MVLRIICLMMAVLCGLGLALPAHAAEPLFVGQVHVDIMGENATDARLLALTQAKHDALDDLFKKFVPEHRATIMENLNQARIEKLVRNVEVLNEAVDGNRFRADIRVSYSANMFNDLITRKIEAVESDQQLLTTASLVLPIFEAEDRLYLFESVNPWGSAWANVARNIGRGQIVTPFGDSVDHSIMSAKRAEKADFKEFAPLRRRYGVRDVIILHAKFLTAQAEETEPQEEDDGDAYAILDQEEIEAQKRKQNLILHIKERRVQAKEDEIKIMEYMIDASEDKEELMDRAARDLGIYIMNMQGKTVLRVNEAKQDYHKILLVTPVTTMKRFSWVKERINRLPGAEKLEILALKPEQADMQLHYTGEREVLLQSMEDVGLKFIDRTNYVEIRL